MVTAIDNVPACPELDAAVLRIVLSAPAEQDRGAWVIRSASGQVYPMPRLSAPTTPLDGMLVVCCQHWLQARVPGYALPLGTVAGGALQTCRDVCRAAGLAGITVGVAPVEHPICIRCRERHAPEAYCQIREGLRRPQ